MQNIFNKNRLAGFTLIEMFIVIAVIGILAGVVFRGTAVIQASARDTRRVADIRTIQNHLETYFMMCGHYPGGFSGGRCSVITTTGIISLQTALAATGIIPIDGLPMDPIAGRAREASFFYFSDGTPAGESNTRYFLGVRLERHHRAVGEGFRGTTPTGFPAECGAGTMLCVTN